MKKISLLFTCTTALVLLSSCTLPWQKTTPPAETETIVEGANNMPATGSTTNTVSDIPVTPPEPQKDITPSDTPKAIAEGGIYLPYTSTAVAQAK